MWGCTAYRFRLLAFFITITSYERLDVVENSTIAQLAQANIKEKYQK